MMLTSRFTESRVLNAPLAGLPEASYADRNILLRVLCRYIRSLLAITMTKTSTARRSLTSALLRLCVDAVLVVSIVGWLPALLLLVVATNLSSMLVAASVLLALSLTSWWAIVKRCRRRSPPRVVTIPAAILAASFYSSAALWAPSGRVSPESSLRSEYRGQARVSRFSPAWLVDEADQVRLGGVLLPYIDPFMSGEQGKRFARTFISAYAELRQSPDFVQVGSTMGDAYANMFFGAASRGHAYLYRPSAHAGRHCPVIVFLHGWLGNMKAYIWTWARFADQNGFVVVCPTFGNGIWKGQNADETLRWLDGLIRTDPMCDAQQVYVVGLSNGGTGVTRWATTLPNTYRGLVMISPAMKGADSPAFVSAVGTRPILVVHGEKDNRIPPDYVNRAVAVMREKGLRVESVCYHDEDHVLVLSSARRFQADLLAWIANREREPSAGAHGLPPAVQP